jgi:hypothetical protein
VQLGHDDEQRLHPEQENYNKTVSDKKSTTKEASCVTLRQAVCFLSENVRDEHEQPADHQHQDNQAAIGMRAI